MSLFSVLNTATQGLTASQLGMDVTGQNISNANVNGYSRKRIDQSATYRYDPQFGQMGMGTEVNDIQRMRDSFVQGRMDQNSQVGYYTQTNDALQTIQSVITEPSDQGLQNALDSFFNSWQDLSQTPEDASLRTVVQTDGQNLTDAFNSLSNQLTAQQQACNDQIATQVDQINSITKQIYNLNNVITEAKAEGQNANDSLDQRDQLVTQLSKIVDVTTITNNLDQMTVTCDGNILVSGANYSTLETTTTPTTLPNGAIQNNVGIRFINTRLALVPQSGTIKALVDTRDSIIPKYQAQLDTLAKSLVQSVNALHSTGYSLNGITGINFFNPNVTGAGDISESAAIKSDVNNIAAASAGQAQIAQTNALPAGTHNFGIPAIQLYSNPASVPPTIAHNLVQGSVIVKTPNVTLQEGVDYSVNYTNGTIQMLHAGYDASDLTVDFQYNVAGFAGPGDNSNALAIAQLSTNPTMNLDAAGNPTTTFTEYYSDTIASLGLDANQADANLTTRQNLLTQYQTQQDGVAGVSLDEEMTNLIKYQNTYAATARIVTTTNTMLESLINM